MPNTANLTVTTILDGLSITMRYAELLVKDIPEEKFTHMPHPTMNHPAFLIGHLSLYPDKALDHVGMGERTDKRTNYTELFDAPAPCRDEPGLYPAKEEIVEYFFARHRALQQALPAVAESTLQQPLPSGSRAASMFQSVGSAVNFYMNNHNMLHLGQLSAWRRAAGLPSVM